MFLCMLIHFRTVRGTAAVRQRRFPELDLRHRCWSVYLHCPCRNGKFAYTIIIAFKSLNYNSKICAFFHEICVNFTTGAGVSCAAGGEARVRCDDSAGGWNHNWNRDSPRDCSLRREVTHPALKGARRREGTHETIKLNLTECLFE